MSLTILINSDLNKFTACEAVKNLKTDGAKKVVISDYSPKRNNEQNALMWSSLLADISKQTYMQDRLHSVKTWNVYLKEQYLPEHFIEGITKKDYQKWIEMPDGTLRLNASTKDLKVKGMSNYLEECYAFGADLGVRFSVSPRDAVALGLL